MSEKFELKCWLRRVFEIFRILNFSQIFWNIGIMANFWHFQPIFWHFGHGSICWHFWIRVNFRIFLDPGHFSDIFLSGSIFWHFWTLVNLLMKQKHLNYLKNLSFSDVTYPYRWWWRWLPWFCLAVKKSN